ncbi:MAG TPA: UDP-N-acetylmuramoyl-L-alanine--D-glutamate ligase [Deltaproteobacteria bacterium]|nr:UDP-N-acetylmuramoyl-L-alanine--D-glutamate ligase [Deltaproteobacteria bacterium]
MTIPEKILIVGLGETGLAVARFLHGMGKRIGLADEKSEKELSSMLSRLNGIPFIGHFGPHSTQDFLQYPMIIVSPGVDSELPALKEVKSRGVRVIGEIELAFTFIQEPIIAITGTNGKTTTTTLVGEIFTKAFNDVFVGGNIGNPLINYVTGGKKARYVITEISSFQLETIETFRPDLAMLLNIAEDHLDRYRSYEEYKHAKYRIFENQTPEDYAVINSNLSSSVLIRAHSLFFSTETVLDEGAFLKNENMYVRLGGKEFVYKRSLSPLVGIHNTENILGALLACHLYGIDRAVIEDVLGTFKGLPHRIEPVRQVKGVTFYNDSKATNVDAALRALESIPSNIILIAGGRDKGGSYKAVINVMKKVKALILIGEAKERIKNELGPYVDTYMDDDLQSAVMRAWNIARPGDVVLFSPMCSSFDMFQDYKHRGETFKRIVESL